MRLLHTLLPTLIWALGLPAFSAAPSSLRPNILLILTDDQSYKTLSCYPEALPGVRTPAIDALAANGIRFTHSYIGSWCMPARATLLTGRHPHGVQSMRMTGKYPASEYDPKQCPFFPALLRQNGYHTAQIGKWHTGTDAGYGRDWDYQIVWNRPKHPDNAGAYYDRQLLETNGAPPELTTGYSTDNYTRWACDYIRGQHRDTTKPWYLWLCYGGVHGPTTPAARHKGLHKNDAVPVPADIFPPRPAKPAYLSETQSWSRGLDGKPVPLKSGETFGDTAKQGRSYADLVHQLNDCVQSLDEGVGRVIEALRETGQLHHTLVVLTADQGFATGEHGFRTKLAPYDANYRSPLIVSMPRSLPSGKVCTKPVNGTDLVATFAAFSGVSVPWNLHGRDLTPLLMEPEKAPWPHPCFFEATGAHFGTDVAEVVKQTPDHAEYHHVPWYAALNDGRYKYIRYLTPNETEELYDLQSDPDELTNLADQQQHRDTLKRLRGAAIAELRRTESGYADALPPSRQMQAEAAGR